MNKKFSLSISFAALITTMILLFQSSIAFAAASPFSDDFSSLNSSFWEKADGWTNGNPFYCTWRQNNVTHNNGQVSLSITKDSGSIPYAGGELRTKNFYSFGKYEVTMKPAKNVGTVSSFFTYTGPSDNNPWDEIDIEFLGKDTTIMQLNYYTNGVGNHEYIHKLGFDASESFHTYAFDWQKNYIAWFVDGKEVYRATSNIPQTPSKIMMNLWPGTGVDGWLGSFNGTTPLYAYYDKVSYSTSSSTTPPTTPPTTAPPTTSSSILLGDVNKDTRVNSTDAALIERHVLGITTLEGDAFTAADVSKDKKITSTDASLVGRYILGSITSF